MTVYSYKEALKDNDLIVKVNEFYHDVEAVSYEESHPEIYSYEMKSWKGLFKSVRRQFNLDSITILDVGTGVGFVPMAISSEITKKDKLIISDISDVMLRKAVSNLSNYPIPIKCLKTETYEEIRSDSVDIITMNSVLHHIPDVEKLFRNFNRILKTGGILVIKHEPNIRFANNVFLRKLYHLIKILRPSVKRKNTESKNVFLDRVITYLKEKDIEFSPQLTQHQLQSLVDFHSPTAKGGMSRVTGFNPWHLVDIGWYDASLVECRTYGYFGKIKDNSSVFRRIISSVLRYFFPKDGYYFDIIIKKNK